jgi:hypothetical protein
MYRLLLAVLLAVAAAQSAHAQLLTRRQFTDVVRRSYAIDVDSTLLRTTAAEAKLPLPNATLTVFVTQGEGFACGDGRCSGLWARLADGSCLIVVAEARMLREPWLLRHEYLHHLLQTGDHPWTFQRLGLPTTDN